MLNCMNKAEEIPYSGKVLCFFVIEGGFMNNLYHKIEFKGSRPVIMNWPLVYSRWIMEQYFKSISIKIFKVTMLSLTGQLFPSGCSCGYTLAAFSLSSFSLIKRLFLMWGEITKANYMYIVHVSLRNQQNIISNGQSILSN